MFRTGDVGRLLPSGALELQGRAAFFGKLRGYSVSTGAVEEALKDSSPLVLGAVVAPVLDATTLQPQSLTGYAKVHHPRQGIVVMASPHVKALPHAGLSVRAARRAEPTWPPLTKKLFLDRPFMNMNSRYVLVDDGAPVQERVGLGGGLRGMLRGTLPAYAIPSKLVAVGTSDYTQASSKLDRKELQRLGGVAGVGRVLHQAGASLDATPPATAAEAAVREVWAAVLGLEEHTLSTDDDFFDLGGT